MADAYLTSADVATFNKVDMDLLVSDVLDEAPFLRAMAARTVAGNTFTYTKTTANPSVGFRDINDGVENTKGTYSKVVLAMSFLDASFAVDEAAAMVDERGLDHILAIEAQSHLRQAMRNFEEQILNGTVGGVATAFDGFADQANLNQLADAQVIGAGGSGSDVSSVYLVRFGEGDVQALWGQNGQISIGERRMVERDGSSTGRFNAYAHAISAWTGLKVGSVHSVVRIANLEDAASNSLTDDLISQALSVFPTGRGPSAIVMNRPQLSRLQQSRTATNATGAPAPFPSESFGVPIIVTDSLSQSETAIV